MLDYHVALAQDSQMSLDYQSRPRAESFRVNRRDSSGRSGRLSCRRRASRRHGPPFPL